MKMIILTLFIFFFCEKTFGQNASSSEQLENLTAGNNDETTEDDSYLQELDQYKKNPININNADEILLAETHLLSALQIQNLISYRNLFGKLISIYELQALPGWEPETITKIRPYITVTSRRIDLTSLKNRFRSGTNSILLRYGQTLQRSAGYFIDPLSGKNYYTGSPQKLFLRYRYSFKNLLQYGISGEKDAGENFFKGAQKKGFDFYSAHFFLRDAGWIKSLALGDFTVNFGQGLIQWMSLAFTKSPDVTMIKREADVLRPYNSSGEIVFHRGAGITLKKKKYEVTIFGSYRKLDANFIPGDSLIEDAGHVTSLQTSGYHRTPGEIADKNTQRQLCFGGNISYRSGKFHAGINALQYRFKYPLIKKNEPYNLYALNGKTLNNYSVDYAYTFRNMHFFGEAAFSGNKYPASVNGLLISVSARADISVIYRNISKGFQSLYANAFTESSSPGNEKGIFTGISLRPTDQWKIDGYVDFWRSPWLRYRVNMPSSGADYLIRAIYRPDKKTEISMLYKSGKKQMNDNSRPNVLDPVSFQSSHSWRTGISYKLSSPVSWRNRAEMLWLTGKSKEKEAGFLMYSEILYSPANYPVSGSIRAEYFETGSYNSRLYVNEDDVPYAYSVPVFFGKGYHYYLDINYLFRKKVTFSIKIAQTVYPGINTVSSYLDEIRGNRKTEMKCQLIWKF